MKKAMLIGLMIIFGSVMFAQTQSQTKPPAEKKKATTTEVKAPSNEAKPVAQTAAKPEAKSTGKMEEPKHSGKKHGSKTTGKKEEAKPAESKPAAPPKK